MNSKVLSILIAAFMATAMLAVPLSSVSDATDSAATAEAVDATGSYGILIDESDIADNYSTLRESLLKMDQSLALPENGDSDDMIEAMVNQVLESPEYAGLGLTASNVRASDDMGIGLLFDVTQNNDAMNINISGFVETDASASMSVAASGANAVSVNLNNFELGIDAAVDLQTAWSYNSSDSLWYLDSIKGDISFIISIEFDVAINLGQAGQQIDLPSSINIDSDLAFYVAMDTIKVGDTSYVSIVGNNNVNSFYNDLKAQGLSNFVPSTGYDESYLSEVKPLEQVVMEDFDQVTNSLKSNTEQLADQFIALVKSLNNSTTDGGADILISGSNDMSEILGMDQDLSGILAEMPTFEMDVDAPGFREGLIGVLTVFLGTDGLSLNDGEVSEIRDKVSDVKKESIDAIKDVECEVTFLAQNSDGTYREVREFDVRSGGSVNMNDSSISALKNAPNGMRFIGWSIVVPVESAQDDDVISYVIPMGEFTNVVYSDCYVVAVYASEKTSIDDIFGWTGSNYLDAISAQIQEIVYSNIRGDAEVVLEVRITDGGTVNSVSWVFQGGSSYSGAVQTGVTSGNVSQASAALLSDVDTSSAFELDFTHSGSLPNGTKIVVDVGTGNSGQAYTVYHIDSGVASLASGSVTADSDGKVTLPISSCSSYVFVPGEVVSTPFDGTGSNPSGGTNWLLIGGAAAGVIVLAAVAMIIFRRSH